MKRDVIVHPSRVAQCKDYSLTRALYRSFFCGCGLEARLLLPASTIATMVDVTWKIPSQVLVNLSFRIEVQGPKLAFAHINLPVKRGA